MSNFSPMSRAGRRRLTLAGVAISCAALAGCAVPGAPGAGGVAGGDGHSWKYASFGPPAQFDTVAMESWEEKMSGELDGGLQVTYFNNQTLIPAAESLRQLGDGTADLAYVATSYTPKELPLSQAASLPFQGSDSVAQALAFNELYREYEPLQREYEKHNVHVISALPLGPVVIAASDPIDSVEDLDQLQMRTAGYLLDAYTAVGVSPVAITLPEIYESLERGVLDAVSSITLDVATDNSFHEVAPYIVDSGAGVYGLVLHAMNLDVWNSLSAEEQEAITAYDEEYVRSVGEIVMEKEAASCDILLENGVRPSAFEASDVEKWKKESEEATVGKWVADTKASGAPAEEFLELYNEAYDRQHETSNYVPGISACIERAEN